MFKFKKIASFALAMVMGTAMSVPVFAVETISFDSNSIGQKYKVEFNTGVLFNSQTNKNNLTSVKGNITQVVYRINTGHDVFTIGYDIGEDGFSLEIMEKEISKMIEDVNIDILSEPRLQGNKAISINDLQIESIELFTFNNKSLHSDNIETQFNNVKNVYELGYKEHIVNEPIEHNKAQKESNTIDGSYHYLKLISDEVYTFWHNQLSSSDDTVCVPTLSSPHGGDGNNRYDSGFQWFPNDVDVNFYTDVETDENQTKLWYKYDQSTLDNLNVDTNEALEMEVVFYNYNDSSVATANKGNSFQLIKSGVTWSTNQPNHYKDTNFGDPEEEVSFCVGVDDTTDLVANRWYYWKINGTKGTQSNYANDGRFKVVAQRGYRTIGGGAFSVFAEEHEPMKRLGLLGSQNWVSASENAWDLADANDDWNFVSETDPVK